MEAKKLSPRIPASKMHKLFLLRRILLQKAMQGGEMYFGQLPTLEYIVRHDNCTQNEIAASLLVTPASVTQTTKSLENSGLLKKEVDPQNLRCKRLSATPQGKLVSARCRELHDEFDRRIFAGFSNEEMLQFDAYLGRMICNITGESFPPRDEYCTVEQLEARMRMGENREAENKEEKEK